MASKYTLAFLHAKHLVLQEGYSIDDAMREILREYVLSVAEYYTLKKQLKRLAEQQTPSAQQSTDQKLAEEKHD